MKVALQDLGRIRTALPTLLPRYQIISLTSIVIPAFFSIFAQNNPKTHYHNEKIKFSIICFIVDVGIVHGWHGVSAWQSLSWWRILQWRQRLPCVSSIQHHNVIEDGAEGPAPRPIVMILG